MFSDEFEPAQESEEDDEETIAKEEEEHDEGDNELVDLERSGQMSLDDLLDDLPPEYLEELASKLPSMTFLISCARVFDAVPDNFLFVNVQNQMTVTRSRSLILKQ